MSERRRFLSVSALALVATSVFGFVLAPAISSAATPTPPPAPTEAPPTAAPPTTPPTEAPATTLPTAATLPATTVLTPDTLPVTTSLLPTTTTEVPAPAAPSVVYKANAECDPAIGQTTVSWKVTNNGEAPVTITGHTEDAPLEPNPVPPLGEATATHVIEGPATDEQVTSTVTIDAGGGVVIDLSDEITAGACEGPEAPPDVAFTLSVTPSVSQAVVGETVEYVYCAQNTSTIPLAELRLVDDRIGVIIEGEEPIAPGASVCNTDVGATASYVVQESDAGSVIHNNAVITVQTQEDEPREFQQTATADVAVDLVVAAPLGVSVPICHSTGSLTNSYVFNAPDESGVTEGGHHYDHTDDIIPPGPWAPAGRNWTAEGQALHANGCDNIRLAPVSPTVVQATCIGGSVKPPTITTAPATGISYTVVPSGPYDGTVTTSVTVTATLEVGFNWSPMPAGWTKVDVSVATYPVTLKATRCDAVVPVDPGVDEAECVGGVVTAPTLTLPTTTNISYTTDEPGPYAAGDTVVVTATLTQGAWPAPADMPAGWTIATPTTATYTVTFAAASCLPVTPIDPWVTQASCVGGIVTAPLVTPIGELVVYTVDPKGPYDGTVTTPVTVTATLTDGLAWAQPEPDGWTYVDEETATFAVTLNAASCSVVAPVAPTVTQAACRNGAFVPATVTLPTTDGITYTKDKTDPYLPLPQVVTVTATLTGTGVGWPDQMPDGWTETGATTATYKVPLAAESCFPVLPTDPVVTQATCTAGEVTVPTIELASTPAGVTYVADPAGPYVATTATPVVVTATLSDGLKWGTLIPPWTFVSPTTATFAVTLNAASCSVVAPVAPTVTQAACRNGAFVPATVTLPTTDGITYTKDKTDPYLPLPQVVTVTATLTGTGVGWPDQMPDGWTETGATTATYKVPLAAESCFPVLPTDPVVTQATCTAGEVTVPTIELATEPAGVTYVADPAGPYVATAVTPVTVTATLSDGLKWGTLIPPWTLVNPTTATYLVTLNVGSCDEVIPADPTVVQAVCRNGAFEPATVTFADTDGITYAADPAGPYVLLPAVVTVTATLDDAGVGWPATMPAGWTETDATTATFEPVVLRATSCLPVLPTDPVVTQATCTNGEVTVPTIELASTPAGVTYVADPAGPYVATAATPVVVTATLSDGLKWGTMLPPWVKVDNVTATFAVTLNAGSCDEVTPVAPTVTQAVCRNGAFVPATVTLATTTGITYTKDKTDPYLPLPQKVTVTATLDDAGVGWPETLPDGWTKTGATTATYLLLLRPASCFPVLPTDPVVTQATCTAGEVTVPTIELATEPAGVSYVADPAGPYVATAVTPVTVTATLSDGLKWGTLIPPWTLVNPTTATYLVTLNVGSCDEVIPADPTVVQAVCRNGAFEPATVTFADTDGITYAADPAGPYVLLPAVVTVTATLDDAGVGWPATMPAGWTETDATTATFEPVVLRATSCLPVLPTDPVVTQATCTNGEVTVPTIELASTPAGVTYVADPAGPYVATAATPVVVTATLSDGLKWGTMLPPWVKVDNVTATFAVTLNAGSCDEVTPVAPSFTQAVCRNGVLEPPTLTLPTTDGITYTADPEGPYHAAQIVTVTATLDDEGVGWPATMPEGWSETSSTTATYLVRFYSNACVPVVPEAPDVVQATCINGEVTVPTVMPKTTGFVTYTLDPLGPYDPGTEDYTVTVTAALSDQLVEWGQMPPDWTRVDNLTATYVVELVGTSCDEVTPVAPTNHPAVCVNGALTPPTLTLPTTDGITYSVDVDPPYAPGQTIVVTATLDDAEVGWPDELPPGWTETSSTTATYPHTFDDVACTPVAPVDPVVTQATCASGVVTAATVELASTPGLVYVADPAGPYDPTVDTDVVVTATVLDGFAWEEAAGPSGFAQQAAAPSQVDLPEGWTWVSPTEATFAVTLAAIPPCPETEAPPSSEVAAVAESTTTTSPPAAPTTLTETEAASEVAAAPTTTSAPPTTSPPTTSVAPAAAEAIPATGASGLPGQLGIAVLALAGGALLVVIGGRRRIH